MIDVERFKKKIENLFLVSRANCQIWGENSSFDKSLQLDKILTPENWMPPPKVPIGPLKIKATTNL